MRPGASQSSTGNLGKWNTSTWMTLTTYHHVKNEYVWLILEAQSLLQQPFMLRLMDEILHQNPIKTVIFAISTGWPDIFHQQNSGFCTLVASQPAWQFSPHSSFPHSVPALQGSCASLYSADDNPSIWRTWPLLSKKKHGDFWSGMTDWEFWIITSSVVNIISNKNDL